MWLVQGDLLDEQIGIIVHGVNAQGKFNAGFAKQLRAKYPQTYEDYMAHYRNHGLHLGQVILTVIHPQLIVASGVTQQYYGRDPDVVYVNYEAVARVFEQIKPLAMHSDLPVKFPEIGCGLANGDWTAVQNVIDSVLLPEVDPILYRQK